MIAVHRYAFAGILASVCLAAQATAAPDRSTTNGSWRMLDSVPADVLAGLPWIRPVAGQALALDLASMRTVLATAPMEDHGPVRNSTAVIVLPTPDGGTERFAFVESPVMEPPLQARYPQIRTYAGQGIDNPGASVRFDLTPQGFHAQVLQPSPDGTPERGAWYIDPLTRGDTTHYMSYWRGALAAPSPWVCSTPPGPVLPAGGGFGPRDSTVIIKLYRAAVAATGEYTAYVSSPNAPNVTDGLAAVVTTIQRVNGPYHIDLAINLTLVANNDQIIYTNANTDPYSGTISDMQCQNAQTLHNVIGDGNFDIGHLCAQGNFGGNAGGVGTVCNNGTSGCNGGPIKARGFTGSYAPTGSYYWIDYVAHEMGHQFGGNHTFNGIRGSCCCERVPGSAFEPGSGITIMGYAGICNDNYGNDDLASPSPPTGASIPMFNFKSIQEITDYTNGQGCGTGVDSGNHPPGAVMSPGPFVVPTNTPFRLSATGANYEQVEQQSVSIEQMDLGPALVLGPDTGQNEPLFKPHMHDRLTGSSERLFPPLANILNRTTAAGEYLPQNNRAASHFRAVVRDNQIQGGGVSFADVTIQFVHVPGGFLVTAPTNGAYCGGTNIAVTWNVANTNQPPISCDRVAITLSFDGGQTFPSSLGDNIPNAGAAIVTLPSVPTTQARIKVEADNNIFFSINSADFEIDSGPPTITGQPASASVCPGNPVQISATFGGGHPQYVQWYKNDAAIADSGPLQGNPDSSHVVIASAQHSDSGDYTVVVHNACASVTSSVAHVQVGVTFDAQPQSQTPQPCDNSVISVQARGVGSLSYQWQKNGGPLPSDPRIMGFNTPNLVIQGVHYEDEGTYTCDVTDSCETRTTAPASITLPTPAWLQRAASGPAHQSYSSDMAYDPVRQVTVLYGGSVSTDGFPSYSRETWEWNGANWTQRFPPHNPDRRAYHVMAFDSYRHAVVLVGGVTAAPYNNEVWAYDGNDWMLLSPNTAAGPPPNHTFQTHAAFDSNRQKLVLPVASSVGSYYHSDTWEFDSQSLTWTLAATDTAFYAYGAGLAYDSVRQTVYAQSYEWLGSPDTAATWQWNGSGWTRLGVSTPARYAALMAFDATRSRSTLYGCCRGQGPYYPPLDTYAFNGTSWQLILPGTNPITDGVIPTAMVYDSARRAMVMAGSDYSGSFGNAPILTWEFRYLDRVYFDGQPQPVAAIAGDTVTYSVAAAGWGTLSYQWRRNGSPLANGPTGSGAVVSGANTATLTITNVRAADAASYDCLVSNNCGSATSQAAALTVTAVHPGDINGDGNVDVIDRNLFVNVLLGLDADPGHVARSDMNGDSIADGRDIQPFVQALFGP